MTTAARETVKEHLDKEFHHLLGVVNIDIIVQLQLAKELRKIRKDGITTRKPFVNTGPR